MTIVTAYALFALAEVGLEIENPWGEGENDLDLDRYCNLLALDLGEIMGFGNAGREGDICGGDGASGSKSSSRTLLDLDHLDEGASGYGTFEDVGSEE